MKLNWMILCYKELENGGMSIIHACVYEKKPVQSDWDSLREELATDEEFGMIDDDDYEMLLVDREEGYRWFEDLGIPETSEELDR